MGLTRKIKSSPVKVTGYAPDDQQFESALEEDFFVLLRFNLQVERWVRPIDSVVWYDKGGKSRKYTPDVLVFFKPDEGGEVPPPRLCEVKPSFDDEDRERKPVSRLPRRESAEENELKWAAARREAKRKGWDFLVYTEKEIRTDRLRNAKFLLRYLERGVVDRGSDRVLCLLREQGPMTLKVLLDQLGADAHARAQLAPTVYRLISEGQVKCDLDKPFRMNSIISV